jgi:hypothetical protein
MRDYLFVFRLLLVLGQEPNVLLHRTQILSSNWTLPGAPLRLVQVTTKTFLYWCRLPQRIEVGWIAIDTL